MLLRLAALFVLVPLAELAILVWLGGRVGLVPTIGLVIFTGILGAALARQQGLATLARFRQKVEGGGIPGEELADGLLILVAAAVLLTPGLLTDLAGFALLMPGLRGPVRRRLRAWIERRALTMPGAPRPAPGPGEVNREMNREADVIDADFEVLEDDES